MAEDMRDRNAPLSIGDEAAFDWDKGGGLLPAIVQDADTRQVLMLAYMNEPALRETLSTMRATFFSRSRQEIWRKGETSGAVMHVRAVFGDCDDDAILVLAEPAGPACHLGTVSCFDADDAPGLGMFARLERVVARQADAPSEESYTRRLLDAGVRRIAQKLGEEGVETALAGACEDDGALIGESADLIYHLIVLLRARGLGLGDVAEELRRRRNES